MAVRSGDLPVIWATEVLDHMARTGQPPRAEVTDAVMARRRVRDVEQGPAHRHGHLVPGRHPVIGCRVISVRRQRCCGRSTVGKMTLALQSDGRE